MRLYLVKSEAPKIRYFFQSEEKAVELYEKLSAQFSDSVIQLKYLKTSDEWEVEQIIQQFGALSE